MNEINFLVVFLTTLFFAFHHASSSSSDRHYNVGDRVPFFVNKVGPLNNPSETYEYYDLPFCRPEKVIKEKESLGEVLSGDRLTSALFNLTFRENKPTVTLCEKKLKPNDLSTFRKTIFNDFYFQMYYDDLPLWAFIGKVENSSTEKYYLFKHVRFDVLYNEDQVIEIHAFSDPNHAVDITNDVEIDVRFTYSVLWNATSALFDNRMERYSRASLLQTQKQIHWFSILNSIVIIVLLMGMLTLLFFRHLRNDLRKYSIGDEEEENEVGWKYLHGDVFRYPSYSPLFCSVLGSGTQLLTIICTLFGLSFVGVLYPYNRGSLSSSLVVIYTLTSLIAGYTTSSFHSQFSKSKWVKSVLLAGIIYAGPVFLTMTVLNSIAISYGSTSALPFGTILVLLLIYVFVNIPLLFLGGAIGYRFRSEFQAPCPTKRVPREIPSLAWYRKTPGQMSVAGLLPFSAIVLELHYLYATLWGYKIYLSFGILFITFIILVLLTATLSVGLTYIQLSVEDHRWWWRSVLRGGSTAIFMFGYCIYYYSRSNMSGLMQISFFFGYNACICYALFLMLGTIGFRVSLLFVRRIYHAVKSE